MTEAKSARGGWVTSDVKLTGKTVLITGANTGIGLETAIALAKREARVLIACRNLQKAEKAKAQVITESGNDNIVVKKLDLSSFESIRSLANDINQNEERLDILINNAGVLLNSYAETSDGYEMHFGVNHLGHFLLTNLLVDILKRSAPSRIVTVASSAHQTVAMDWEDPNRRKSFNPTEAYSQSKLMNVLFSRELSKRVAGTGVTSNCLHPGIVATEFFRDEGGCCGYDGFFGCIFSCLSCMTCCQKTPHKGAQTTIYCAIAPELGTVSGKYFADCKVTTVHRRARSEKDAERLWELSNELCGLQTTI